MSSEPEMPSSYRVITARHQNTRSAYRRFERQVFPAASGRLLQRVGRDSITAGIVALVIVLAFLGGAIG